MNLALFGAKIFEKPSKINGLSGVIVKRKKVIK